MGMLISSDAYLRRHWGLEKLSSFPVQFSRVRLFATAWIAARQASLSITNSRVHSNSRPSSRWCHPTISSSVVPFFSCPQSLPASESFPMSQLFAWGDQNPGVSALASSFQRTPRTDSCRHNKHGEPGFYAQLHFIPEFALMSHLPYWFSYFLPANLYC